MVRQILEIRVPMRVDGPVGLEVAADPIEKLGAAFVLGNLNRIMDAAEANAFLHEGTEKLQAVLLDCGMTTAAVRINDNCIRAIKGIGGLWPAIGMNGAGDAGNVVQALLQEQA